MSLSILNNVSSLAAQNQLSMTQASLSKNPLTAVVRFAFEHGRG